MTYERFTFYLGAVLLLSPFAVLALCVAGVITH